MATLKLSVKWVWDKVMKAPPLEAEKAKVSILMLPFSTCVIYTPLNDPEPCLLTYKMRIIINNVCKVLNTVPGS